MFVLATLASAVAAHPPHEPDHGVDEETACTLWAGDEDVTNVSAYDAGTEGEEPEICSLASVTDIPLDSPPAAVERWNEGDIEHFPQTGADRSAYPRNTSLENGRFIRDAYTRIFAIQPSTRAHLSPGEQPHYVAPTGTVSGTVDYRVTVPAGDTHGTTRVHWSLVSHDIRETRLEIDGATTATTGGSHTTSVEYDLDGTTGDTHRIGLVAEIEVGLSKRTKRCVGNYTNGSCDDWDVSREQIGETIVVRDEHEVVTYDLAVAGHRTAYPDGDLGLVLFKSHPWLGYSLPDGEVNGVWRFYVARESDWDSLVTVSDSDQTVAHSPLHPLQVHAYPFEPGPTATPSKTVSLLEIFGSEAIPPRLPSTVNLDVLEEPYKASYGIATRTQTTDHDLAEVTAYGLVRGVTVDVTERLVLDVPVEESNLTLSVENETDETVTVEVALREAVTDEPINTQNRAGYVSLAGHRVNTTGNGTATVTVARPDGGLSARFEPGRWWDTRRGYVGDTAVVSLAGAELGFVSLLFEMGLPVSFFLLAVFVIDRITGWGVWPPWRVG